jgi:hypothetical protein
MTSNAREETDEPQMDADLRRWFLGKRASLIFGCEELEQAVEKLDRSTLGN